ncbi:MAG: hypothetical protein H0U52_06670, partial [Chloroflexi bacterium]|nr:hypothetical protein [Chloroflexota bacterium]
MRNWVLSDDTSLDEAMAAARNDEERALTSHQLDAFHSTFNFCMTCRQYTCGNCWNAAEGRCLTCAPNLGHEILTAPFPDQVQFEPMRIEAESWPEVDLTAAAGEANGNGHTHDGVDRVDSLDPWASAGATGLDDVPEFDAAARLAFLSGEEPTAAPVEPVEAVVEPVEAVAEPVEAVAEPVEAVAEPVEAVAEPVEPVAEPVEAVAEPVEAVAEPVEPVAEPVEP